MEVKVFFAIFFSVFLAELGDKTQLATVCFAADQDCKPIWVFLASSAALVSSSLLAVLVGSQLSRFISPQHLKLAAGAMFVLIGLWFVWGALKG